MLLLLALFLLPAAGCQSQDKDRGKGYSIRVSLENAASDSLIFSGYQGAALRRIQALLPEGGQAVLEGSPALPPGMYLLEIKDKTSIPLFISEGAPQRFSLSADPSKMPASLKIEGSPENRAFLDYQLFLQSLQPRETSLRNKSRLYGGNSDSLAVITAEFNRLAADRTSREQQIAEEFPQSTLVLFLRSSREPEIPEPRIDPSLPNHEQLMQEYYFRYMTQHFFDRTDFSDPRTAAMPLLEQRASYFFRQMVPPHPDSLAAHSDALLEKPEIHPAVSLQLTRTLYDLFLTSSISGGKTG